MMTLHPGRISAVAILAAACSAPSTAPGAPGARADADSSPPADASAPAPKPWAAALDDLAVSAAAIYSFSFDGSPPLGSRLRFGLHLTDRTGACARYGGGGLGPSARDFWYLEVGLSRAEGGEYAVTTDRLSAGPDRAASVTLVHRSGGEAVERYPALSGTLALAGTPTLETFAAGRSLRVTLDVSFASHAVQALECRGGRGTSAPADPTSCSCLDDEGLHSECTLKPGHEQCCFDGRTERLAFHLTADAAPCAAMCRAVPGLPDYCGELGPR